MEVEEGSTATGVQQAPKVALDGRQTFTVTFLDEDPPQEGDDHNRTLYVSEYICEKKVDKMLVNGGSVVSILSLQTLELLGISTDELQQTRLLIQRFNQNGQRNIGNISLHLTIGNSKPHPGSM
ncbi:hypothetical protein LIER_12909 [Lithospermum erythrorhizon]|uniref:Uncharacterized protein n=1 Tax=Lithospermum erythrorhizon TaxID=34254 RepID=A0AAV3PVD8_LITER